MVESGCDVIEIGLPYSDPVMDGPTIQAAAQQALEGGVRTSDVLRTVEAVAATGTPTVVMTYWNPVERYGVERFAADLANAGGAGLITPDLTPDSRRGVDRRRRRPRPRQGLPGRPVLDRRAAALHRRGLPRVHLRHRGHGRHGRPRPPPPTLAGPLVERTRAVTDLPIGVGPRRLQRRPGRRGRVVRRRRDRGLRLRPRRCSTPTTVPAASRRSPP